MGFFYRSKRTAGWLMLALALLAGVAPATLAEVDSHASNAGGGEPHGPVHDHADGSLPEGAVPSDDTDHHDVYCTDHCCSDACSAALGVAVSTLPTWRHARTGRGAIPAETGSLDERFIPPRVS